MRIPNAWQAEQPLVLNSLRPARRGRRRPVPPRRAGPCRTGRSLPTARAARLPFRRRRIQRASSAAAMPIVSDIEPFMTSLLSRARPGSRPGAPSSRGPCGPPGLSRSAAEHALRHADRPRPLPCGCGSAGGRPDRGPGRRSARRGLAAASARACSRGRASIVRSSACSARSGSSSRRVSGSAVHERRIEHLVLGRHVARELALEERRAPEQRRAADRLSRRGGSLASSALLPMSATWRAPGGGPRACVRRSTPCVPPVWFTD